jgi:hypothetical protein
MRRAPRRFTGSMLAPALGAVAVLAISGQASAQAPPTCTAVPCTEVHTVGAANQAAPLEQSFTISNAGTYQVTLTDLGAQLTPSAPLQAVELAVTTGTTIVGTPLMAAGTATLTASSPGTYVLHIVGTPGNGLGSGAVGVEVTASDGTVVDTYSGTLTTPQQALPSTEALLSDTFTVSGANAGSYTITLTDLKLQGSLATLLLLVVVPGGASPIATLSGPNSMPVTLPAGTYDVFAVAQTAANASSGLYSIEVASPGGAVAYGKTVPVGGATLLGSTVLDTGTYTLSSADLKLPAALSQLYATVVQGGQAAATLAAAGSTSFTVVTANSTYQTFAAGVPPNSGAGSYAVQIAPQAGGQALLSEARPVTAPCNPPSICTSAFSYDANVASAGTYTSVLTDFGFPSTLTSINWGVAQAGQVVVKGSNATSMNFNAATGPATALVFVQTGASGGLFNLNVGAGGGATPLIDATQGAGTLVSQRQISITTPGTYQVTAADLGFPENLQNFYVALTQDATPVGTIFGAGTFDFTASAGNYFISFIAQPGTSPGSGGIPGYGTYALSVDKGPPAPTVNLTSNETTVSSGGTVQLTWSTQNATSCTASDGWSGSEPTSGTAMSPTIMSNATFTLTCTGPGGTTAQSVSVTVSADSPGGKGGVDPVMLAVLGALLVARRRGLFAPPR